MDGVPDQWQIKSTHEQLAQKARDLGLPVGQSVTEHVVFLLPDTESARHYKDFVEGHRQPNGLVGVCLEPPETFSGAALAGLDRSLQLHGSPDSESLCQAFFSSGRPGPRTCVGFDCNPVRLANK